MAKRGNSIVVPEAKEALERFKMEAANEVGVNLKQGYNGASWAGSFGTTPRCACSTMPWCFATPTKANALT